MFCVDLFLFDQTKKTNKNTGEGQNPYQKSLHQSVSKEKEQNYSKTGCKLHQNSKIREISTISMKKRGDEIGRSIPPLRRVGGKTLRILSHSISNNITFSVYVRANTLNGLCHLQTVPPSCPQLPRDMRVLIESYNNLHRITFNPHIIPANLNSFSISCKTSQISASKQVAWPMF